MSSARGNAPATFITNLGMQGSRFRTPHVAAPALTAQTRWPCRHIRSEQHPMSASQLDLNDAPVGLHWLAADILRVRRQIGRLCRVVG